MAFFVEYIDVLIQNPRFNSAKETSPTIHKVNQRCLN